MDKTTEEKLVEARAMDRAEFVTEAIHKLRNVEKSDGIHVVYTGFNQMLELVYEGEKARDIVDALVKDEGFAIRPVKGGVMLYAPEDAENQVARANQAVADKTLDRILS